MKIKALALAIASLFIPSLPARIGFKTNAAISTIGTVVAVSTAIGGTFVPVLQTTDIPDPAMTAADLKASNLGSTAEEYINGLSDSTVIKITGQRVAVDPGQNMLRDHDGAPTPLYFKITFPDGEILSFAANVKKFSVTGGTNAVVMFDVSVRPTGTGIWSGTGGPT